MSISVKSISHVPYEEEDACVIWGGPCPSLSSLSVMYHMGHTYMGHYIYMGLTMSISMKPICDVCIYIRMYARICMHACMCVCVYVCMHAYMHACMCVCVCVCVCDK
jgi:hypothetical protein